jgi:hypothetical protein
MQSRTVSGWVVANGDGLPFVETVSRLRHQAVFAYHEACIGVYPDDRKRYGVQVVRCTIITEPKK